MQLNQVFRVRLYNVNSNNTYCNYRVISRLYRQSLFKQMYSPKVDFICGRSKETKSTDICSGKLFIPRLKKIRQKFQDLSDIDTTDKSKT
jgi:hypothetical protein